MVAPLTLAPSEYVTPGLSVRSIWSSPTNLAESTAPVLMSLCEAEVSIWTKPFELARESHSSPMPKMSTTQTMGVRRMRLKSMCIVRGLAPRPSCSFRHISSATSVLRRQPRSYSGRKDRHNDRTPHRGGRILRQAMAQHDAKRLTGCRCSRLRCRREAPGYRRRADYGTSRRNRDRNRPRTR